MLVLAEGIIARSTNSATGRGGKVGIRQRDFWGKKEKVFCMKKKKNADLKYLGKSLALDLTG